MSVEIDAAMDGWVRPDKTRVEEAILGGMETRATKPSVGGGLTA